MALYNTPSIILDLANSTSTTFRHLLPRRRRTLSSYPFSVLRHRDRIRVAGNERKALTSARNPSFRQLFGAPLLPCHAPTVSVQLGSRFAQGCCSLPKTAQASCLMRPTTVFHTQPRGRCSDRMELGRKDQFHHPRSQMHAAHKRSLTVLVAA